MSWPDPHSPPYENKFGLVPGPAQTNFGTAHWSVSNQPVKWSIVGGQYEYLWNTSVLDNRAEWQGTTDVVEAQGYACVALGTYGMNRYVNVLIAGRPAIYPDLRVYSHECGNPVNLKKLFQITQEVNQDIYVQAGGTTVASGSTCEGASSLQFSIPPAMRFWQLFLRFTYPLGSTPPNLQIYAASN